MDKVCFIGQSGTGKTTILNILNELISGDAFNVSEEVKGDKALYSCDYLLNTVKCQEGKMKESNKRFPQTMLFHYEEQRVGTSENINEFVKHYKTILINFPAEFNERFSEILKRSPLTNPFDFIKSGSVIDSGIEIEKESLKRKRVYDFKKDNPLDIWKSILMDASDYMVSELSFSQKITKALIKNRNKANELVEEFTKWQSDNPSPFIELAKVVNPIIEKFYCKIKTDPDFERAEDLFFIKIETTNDIEIPFNLWSTGTKRVVLTALPLHYLETNNTIITIDEPESSLYPDVQSELVDFYSKLAPNAQFFYATHSPIIASSFEPWEIVELKFDYEKGKVFQEEYFEGERHIDNYNIFPEYLRWDSILTKVFDLPKDSNEKRDEKLAELSQMEAEIKSLTNIDEKKLKFEEFKKLADKLDWHI